MLTDLALRAFLPALVDVTGWTEALEAACTRFQINTRARLAAFLAQTAHESTEFRHLVENLNYSSAERIRSVWPTRFTTVAAAQPYVHQQEQLANHVYCNRNGNGDEASGDGWKYRGRGLLQLTGRAAYRAAGRELGLPLELQPELASFPGAAALSAAQYWSARGLNRLADEDTLDAFDAISRKINGGSAGLLERRALWARAKAALT